MNIGNRGLHLIKSFEGLRLEAYMPTPHDVPTIGYGHTQGVKLGTEITITQATAFLRDDLAWVERAVNGMVSVPLNQNQYDALCSFVYNLGAANFGSSTLLRMLNAGDYQGAADQLPRWNKQKRKVLLGLTRRRAAERALFLSVADPIPVTPDAQPNIIAVILKLLMSLFGEKK